MKGVGLSSRQTLEVLSAYSAPEQDIESVAATPGWQVVGSFFMPKSLDGVKLEMIGFVSQAGLTMRARFFDTLELEPVAGIVATLTETIETRVLSGEGRLEGNRTHQIQVEVTGASGQFGVMRMAAATV